MPSIWADMFNVSISEALAEDHPLYRSHGNVSACSCASDGRQFTAALKSEQLTGQPDNEGYVLLFQTLNARTNFTGNRCVARVGASRDWVAAFTLVEAIVGMAVITVVAFSLY